MSINKNNYNEYVKRKTPNSPIFKNCVKAFCVGGLICIIGEIIGDFIVYAGVESEQAKKITPIILIFIGGALTAAGVYDKIGKFAGGGSIIPITGFANSIVSSAMEFKKEGLVMGLGSKIFTVAGPVIVFGAVASVFYGLIYCIISLF